MRRPASAASGRRGSGGGGSARRRRRGGRPLELEIIPPTPDQAVTEFEDAHVGRVHFLARREVEEPLGPLDQQLVTALGVRVDHPDRIARVTPVMVQELADLLRTNEGLRADVVVILDIRSTEREHRRAVAADVCRLQGGQHIEHAAHGGLSVGIAG